MADDNTNLSYSSAEDDVRDERNSRLDRHDNYQEEADDRGNDHDGYDDSNSRSSSGDDGDDRRQEQPQNESERSASSSADTIALFGAYGPTGHHFFRLALDAGYRVRVLVVPGATLEHDFEDVVTISGSLEDAAKVQETVYSSTYVVCMLGHTLILPQRQDKAYPKDSLLKFVNH